MGRSRPKAGLATATRGPSGGQGQISHHHTPLLALRSGGSLFLTASAPTRPMDLQDKAPLALGCWREQTQDCSLDAAGTEARVSSKTWAEPSDPGNTRLVCKTGLPPCSHFLVGRYQPEPCPCAGWWFSEIQNTDAVELGGRGLRPGHGHWPRAGGAHHPGHERQQQGARALEVVLLHHVGQRQQAVQVGDGLDSVFHPL